MQEIFQRRGEGRFQVDPGAGGRLGEPEPSGMEEIAVGVEGRERALVDGEVAGGAVEGVADDRMMQRGEVDANLVRATSVELDFEQCCGADAGEGAPVGAGLPGAGKDEAAAGRHANATLGVTGYGEIDDAGGVVEV